MIYFDIDDTLLDYRSSQDLAARQFARRYSTYLSNPDEFPKAWDAITEYHMGRYLSGELSFEEQRRCRIRDSLGLALSAEEADQIFQDYYQIYQESWCLFPEVERALSMLSGNPLGVITNGDKTHQCYKLERLGILGHFSVMITPACAGAPKPGFAIFRLGAERAGLHPRECWYIGDNFRTDYLGARDAGFKSVWLNRLNRHETCSDQCRDLIEFAKKVRPEE